MYLAVGILVFHVITAALFVVVTNKPIEIPDPYSQISKQRVQLNLEEKDYVLDTSVWDRRSRLLDALTIIKLDSK